ncbi:transport permease protein [Sphaerisporangium krabiense]|uniref:Transport permease protein n=1 Tax=Sphaerisporangium krabiense TaxID=763782 RepID=A0A7W8Z2U9_9ACTN|nr:ABC transporter permease [Sphaerisporangium krabiense]MBB5626389.1 ABC-2 type transport system permease protein [Sphaerisporangium krabiense]GII63307.1 transport permease protein [Sphaerisporangium krabiense]
MPATTSSAPHGALRTLLWTETKLYLREPLTTFFTLALPLGLLLILGNAIPGFRDPDPSLGGERVVDTHLPVMMIVLSVMISAFSAIPAALAVYRERGVLRRMSVTPVAPRSLLLTQLLLNLATSVVAVILMIVAGALAFGTHVPGRFPLFALTFLLGVCGLFGLGLCLAAVVPSSRAAGGIGSVVTFPLLFLAGMWVPRELMPDILRKIGDFTPTGAFGQAMRDAWAGATPEALHLVVLAVWAVGATALGVRAFRWE